MPSIIRGEPGSENLFDSLPDKNYDYPKNLDLKPGSELHKTLVDKILARARISSSHMSKRHAAWNMIDKTLTAYIPLDDEERKSQNKDERKPVSIVFPYSHAILESLLSYMLAAFLQAPVFNYEGHGPDDVIGSILLTKIIDLHSNKNKVGLYLHTQFRDSFAYGLGIAVPTWKVDRAVVSRNEEVGRQSRISKVFNRTESRRVEREEVIFEGNKLINIDPYKALLDPNVPVQEFQEGEFFGWVEHTNMMTLLKEDESQDIFNALYLKKVKNHRTAILSEDASKREVRVGGKSRDTSDATNPVDRIHLYVKLVPADWKLGEREYPEMWYFQVGADSVILQAKPAGLNHGKFPAAIAAPDFDGYSTTPISRLEMLYGMQNTLDWLFNSHIANVRKAVNNMFVYDPYLINSQDLENPQSGWLIRTRKPAWGKGVKDSIQQLEVSDITRQNIGDSSWIVQWMDKIGSTDGAMMGSLRQGGPDRLSSAEFQGTRQGAFSRLERIARLIGMQSMQDIGEFFAAHTQQFAKETTYVNVAGDWAQVLLREYAADIKRGRMKIDPRQLLVAYDVKVRDGSIPGGNYSQVWETMFQVIGANPELLEEFDITRIFKHIARNNGAKNVEQFVRVKVAPDQQVIDQAQRGNLIAMDRSSYAAG